jgi:hypothetical protein
MIRSCILNFYQSQETRNSQYACRDNSFSINLILLFCVSLHRSMEFFSTIALASVIILMVGSFIKPAVILESFKCVRPDFGNNQIIKWKSVLEKLSGK